MRTDFVLDALEQALHARQPERSDALIHYPTEIAVCLHPLYRASRRGRDRTLGGQSWRQLRQRLAETINGLYKAELIHPHATWKSREAVEFATLEWVAWFNHIRSLEPNGYIPPAEAEANYYRQLAGNTVEAT